MATGCKPVGVTSYVGSNPTPCTIFILDFRFWILDYLFDLKSKIGNPKSKMIVSGSSSVVERQPSKLNVASSNLVSRSNFFDKTKKQMASKEEIRAYNRSYYRKNREHLLNKQREKNRRFAEKRRKWLVEYKKTLQCERCDESHPATLTFHHKDDSEKSFEISNAIAKGVSLKRLIAEIDKCEVLCANCHAKEHLSYLYE